MKLRPAFDSPSARSRLGSDERGQTFQDYTLGVSLFVVSVAIILAFIPSILAPFNAPIDDGVSTRADRSAERLTYSLSADGQPNVLNPVETKEFFRDRSDERSVRAYLGLDETSNVNVTIHDPATDAVESIDAVRLAAGEPYPDRPMAASSRVVTIEDEPYRLTVRIW